VPGHPIRILSAAGSTRPIGIVTTTALPAGGLQFAVCRSCAGNERLPGAKPSPSMALTLSAGRELEGQVGRQAAVMTGSFSDGNQDIETRRAIRRSVRPYHACCTTWSQLEQRYIRKAGNAVVNCKLARCFISAPQTAHSIGDASGTSFVGMDFTLGALIHPTIGFASLVFSVGPGRRNQCNETCDRRILPA
jgi:hypothetical protein